ncbi:MAG TPA: hypothetical protein PLL10_06465, partial [Elusimicrobiales bacterium]|nr:hypothetical protein [Elusimicrobiales bacterium]
MKRNIRIFAFGGNEVAPVGITDPKTGKSVNADIPMQWRKTAETAKLVAGIIEAHPKDKFVLTHGNGPQVGNILLRAEYARNILHPLPLDVCGADSQGAMAYMMAQLTNELRARGIDKKTCGIVTQVVVDKHDPDFKNPSKYIGPTYSKQEAEERKANDGWAVKMYKKDDKGHEVWRRVVPSPVPFDIVEIDAVEAVLEAGMIPITVGGGGIPVVMVPSKVKDGMEIYECNHGVKYSRKHEEGKEPLKVYTGV